MTTDSIWLPVTDPTTLNTGDRVRATRKNTRLDDMHEFTVVSVNDVWVYGPTSWSYHVNSFNFKRRLELADGVYLPYASQSVPNVWLKRGAEWLELPNALGSVVGELDPEHLDYAISRGSLVYLGTGATE